LAAEEARRLFDLRTGPLIRLTLLRLADGDHVLLVTMHPIVSDGWSMGIFCRELMALYAVSAHRKSTRGESAPFSELPELPIQYADFAHWQRRWLSGEVLLCVGLKRQLPDPLQKFSETRTFPSPVTVRRLAVRRIDAQDQGVDEEADQPLQLLVRAVGDRRSDAEVVLSRDPGEQRSEPRQQDHEQGHVLFQDQLFEPLGKPGRQREAEVRTPRSRARRPRPVGRQLQDRGIGEPLPPVGRLG
ncbi:MAG: hypothetical protein GY856_09830, partial [bacterium]|nr:hypothetical protein [bacterium]